MLVFFRKNQKPVVFALDAIRRFSYPSANRQQFFSGKPIMRLPPLGILFTVILSGIVICSGLFAANWFWAKTAPDIAGIEEIHATLQNFAPTEAEAKAIAQLRKKTRISQQESPDENVPATESPSAQITVGVRFLKSPYAKLITTHPAMNWSVLLPPAPLQVDAEEISPQQVILPTETTPGRVWSGEYTESPLYVRFLEEANVEKFIHPFFQRQSNVMEAPKIALLSGRRGSIDDTTLTPFVEGISPFEVNTDAAYEPIIRFVKQGQQLVTQGTVLQDGSCRLDMCQIAFSTLDKVELAPLIESNDQTIQFQVPTLHTFYINVPEIVIPKDMSLLVACPGVHDVFFLITPRAFDLAESNEGKASDAYNYRAFWEL